MKIAMDPFEIRGDTLENYFRRTAETGFTYVEFSQRDDFWPYYTHPTANDEQVQRAKRLLKDYGLELASCLPLYRWSSPDEDERQAAVRYWNRAIDIIKYSIILVRAWRQYRCPGAGGQRRQYLGRDRGLRIGWELGHQHRQRLLRWSAIQLRHLVGLWRRGICPNEKKDTPKPKKEEPSPKVIPKSKIPLDKDSYKVGEFNMDDLKSSLKKPTDSTKKVKEVEEKSEDIENIPPAKEKSHEKKDLTAEEIEEKEYEQAKLDSESIDDIFAEVEDMDDLEIISVDSKDKKTKEK